MRPLRQLPFKSGFLHAHEVWIAAAAAALAVLILSATTGAYERAEAADDALLAAARVESGIDDAVGAAWGLASIQRLKLPREALAPQFATELAGARKVVREAFATLRAYGRDGHDAELVRELAEAWRPLDGVIREVEGLAEGRDARGWYRMDELGVPAHVRAGETLRALQEHFGADEEAADARARLYAQLAIVVAILSVAVVAIVLARRRARQMAADQQLLRARNQRLREVDRMKDEFIAVVSHELRTPLTSIRGYLELLATGEVGELTPEQEHFLSVVVRNAERLQRLVGDLLFVAQMDAGRLSLEWEELDLSEIVGDACLAALPAAEGACLSLVSDVDGSMPIVGDRARLGQVLDNLLTNAIKFTAEGGRVSIAAHRRGDQAVVTVADTGIGIPAEERGQVFDRFFRASAATERAIQGTGLGLSIVKAIVEGHSGEIAVADGPEGGTCFTIRISLSQNHDLQLEEAAA